MATAKYTFQIGGISHTLYFGMTSVAIFQQKSVEEVLRMKDNGIKATKDNVDRLKTFAYVIYAGACNWSDLNDEQRPKYADCYILSETIVSESAEIQEKIWTTWKDSQPVAEMLKRLNTDKKTTQKKSPIKPSGRK